MHELKLIVDLMYEGGMSWMRYSISDTAEYGDYTRGPRVVSEETREEMRRILDEIQSGQFAKEWIEEADGGFATFLRLRAQARSSQLEDVGKGLRGMMPWLESETKVVPDE
jgi:ketol-acid reductoisomerase